MDPEADVPIGESAAGVRPTAALVTCVCDHLVHSSVSSGSRRRGDSVQVSLCVRCPGKNHLASDWCRHTNAGNVSLCSPFWPFWKRARQLAAVVGFNRIVFHSVFVGRWQWTKRRCKTLTPCSCQRWNRSTRASSSLFEGKILLATPWKSSGSPKMLTTRNRWR